MRKAILTILMAVLTSTIFGQGFVINGKVNGNGKGLATLRIYYKDGNEQLDSAAIEKDGKFYFRGQITEAIPALLTINSRKTFRLYLEPGSTIELELSSGGKKANKIEGSPLTNKWYSIVNPHGREDYDVHLERLDNWVINNPEHIFCPDIIANFLAYKWDYDELSRSLNTLKGEALNTYYYRHLKERLKSMENLKVGAKAPDFSAPDLQGRSGRISNIAAKNKYTLLVFWASWSKQSREDNPTLLSVYNRFKSSGFEIVGVSLDEEKEEWKQAIKEDKLTWIQLCEQGKWESKAAKNYMLTSIPFNVLLDANNTILAFNIKPQELADKLRQLQDMHGYTVSGEIEGLEEGTMVLELLKEGGEKERQKTKIVNGKFLFEGTLAKTCMATLILPVRSGEISFFLDNAPIHIEGNLDNINAVEITGSESNDEFLEIANNCNSQKNPMQCLMNYVLENPESIYSPLIVSSYLAPYLDNTELRETFSLLSGKAKTMYQYDLLKKHIDNLDKQEEVGEKVKDFTLSDQAGKDIVLSKFAAENSYTLIHFWASWDAKSRLGIKDLNRLYKKYSSDGFNIISVSLDDNKAQWLAAIKQEAMRWCNVSDLKRWNSIIVKLYGLEYIPQNILIDAEGRVIAKNLTAEDLDKRILLLLSRTK